MKRFFKKKILIFHCVYILNILQTKTRIILFVQKLRPASYQSQIEPFYLLTVLMLSNTAIDIYILLFIKKQASEHEEKKIKRGVQMECKIF